MNFNNSISKILESLGYIFPTSKEGVIEFEKKFAKEIQEVELEHWNNPLEILKKKETKTIILKNKELCDKPSGLAQAAREGKIIPDSMKIKMLEDRKNAKNKR